MKTKKYLIVFIFLIISTTSSAEDINAALLNGGSLTGYVFVYQNNNRYGTYLPGTIVQIEGTNKSAVTDENGKWIINDVPAGVYNIKYSRKNFISSRDYNIQFIGTGELVLEQKYLAPIDDRTISKFTFSVTDNNFQVGGKVSSSSTYPACIAIFFSKSYEEIKPEMEFNYVGAGEISADSTDFNVLIYFSDNVTKYFNVRRGETYFIRIAAVSNKWHAPPEVNPVTRKFQILTEGINFSEAKQIVFD